MENKVNDFQIFDEKGNFVKEVVGNNNLMEENKVKINTSDLKKGAYYLHFNSKNAGIKKHKIIIDYANENDKIFTHSCYFFTIFL